MKFKKLAALALAAVTVMATAMPSYAAWTMTADGNQYYNYDNTGALCQNNWVLDYDGDWVALDSDGWLLKNIWIYSFNGNWYYVDGTGAMIKNGDFNVPLSYCYYNMQQGKYVYNAIDAGVYNFAADGHHTFA